MDVGVPPVLRRRSAAVGPTGLAVVVADGDGCVSHWSAGARALFGHEEEAAVGQPAEELLPVAGARVAGASGFASRLGDGPGTAPASLCEAPVFRPAAGRARLAAGGGRPHEDRIDVLWWAYPLAGPGPERLLVLAADAGRFGSGDPSGAGARGGGERIAPGFALHARLPGSGELVRRLTGILPGLGVCDPVGIVDRVRELGCPVVEFGHHERVPVASGRGVPRCRSFAPGGVG
ncbi:PAS domain-containing protein [Streptomyces tirandamycinicus]|uniref:PAS domain-containing protein n=1 Tax=Streptomyces tirandamycinicus TaxID=2174846 RepID=UPI003438BC53